MGWETVNLEIDQSFINREGVVIYQTEFNIESIRITKNKVFYKHI